MKAVMHLFFSPTCPHCPRAKEIASEVAKDRDDVDLEMHSIMEPEGQEMSREYEIMSVPTFIIKGPGFPENIGLRGVQGKDVLNKYIDKALGGEDKEEKGLKIGKFRLKF